MESIPLNKTASPCLPWPGNKAQGNRIQKHGGTHDICNTITENLPQKGVIVYCEAGHMCMKMRGVEKQESTTVTMDYNGNFEDADFRNAFFNYVK